MTISTGVGRGRKKGSKNVLKKDATQKSMDTFLKKPQESSPAGSNEVIDNVSLLMDTSSSNAALNVSIMKSVETSISGSGSNTDSSLLNHNFEPLGYTEHENSSYKDAEDASYAVDEAFVQREEDAFLSVADNGPVDILTKKIIGRLTKTGNKGQPPQEYTVGKTFWVNQCCPSFALSGSTAPDANALYIPRMFLWFPQYLTATGERLKCCNAKCKGYLTSNGITPNARRVIDIQDSFYMLTSRFCCNGPEKHNFTGYDIDIIRQLPLRVQNDFPALLTLKSGISIVLANLIRPLMQNSYLDAALEFKKSSIACKLPKPTTEFSTFVNPKGYSGKVPSAAYIGYVYTSYLENMKERIDTKIMELGGIVLKGDHTLKIIKKIAKIKGVSIFTALYTLCNEFEEIRMKVLAPTKSLLYLEEQLFLQMMKTYLKNHEENPRVFYTNNVVADQPSLDSWIPSLNENVVHTNESITGNPSLPHFGLSGYVMAYLKHEAQMNTMASRLISKNSTFVGFDVEWIYKTIGKNKIRQRISLVQIALFDNFVYLFHLGQRSKLPENLQKIIQDVRIVKVGRGVKQNLFKLKVDYDLEESTVDTRSYINLGHHIMQIGHLGSLQTCSLQSLCEAVLGMYLPKPREVRCGDWNATVLEQLQR
ncbi:hypothetical protein MBANPS3_012260 [Mucor bainieri]